jgi:hypothetical protein
MSVVKFQGWQFDCDPDNTRSLYDKKHSDAELSMTASCQNLIANRDSLFPADVYKLLDRLGIDPANEYEQNRLNRVDFGHVYSIVYYFMGGILSPGETLMVGDACQISFEAHEDPFTRVSIMVVLPWRVNLPEPDA